MSESLKAMLDEQAASVAFAAPDLDVIARTSRRRIRRRRAVTLCACAVVVALVVVSAVQLFRPAGRPPEAADPGLSSLVTWAVGSTIHDGTETIDVGHQIRAYVRTSVGFVTLDEADDIYSVTSRGVTRIGHAAIPRRSDSDQVRLVSDPRGSLAGWVGGDASGLVLQVHDQSTGRTRTYQTDTAMSPDGALFFAIDGRTAYWRIEPREGVFAVDLDTGAERRLASGDIARDLEIFSVENGVLAFAPEYRPPQTNVTSISVGRSIEDARKFTFGENAEAMNQIRLSPTGAWLSYLLVEFNGPPVRDDVRAFTMRIQNANTGDLVTLDLPAGVFGLPLGWLDDTTLQVVVLNQTPGMYTCTVPDGACRLAVPVPPTDLEGTNLVMPGGMWIGD